jgi:PST family polysaccharide transporter
MSYKMSDSLARATGAVYRRAWRQVIYAAAVFTGSYVGHFWGINGVACGVSIALLINFLLMSHLSIKLTGVSWRTIVATYQHGVLLGTMSGLFCYIILTVCRQYISLHIVILLSTLAGVGILVAIILKFFSGSFISDDQKKLINNLIFKRFKKMPLHPA